MYNSVQIRFKRIIYSFSFYFTMSGISTRLKKPIHREGLIYYELNECCECLGACERDCPCVQDFRCCTRKSCNHSDLFNPVCRPDKVLLHEGLEVCEEIDKSMGMGVKCTGRIEKKKCVGTYGGEYVTRRPRDTTYVVELGRGAYIDAREGGNILRYVNNSEDRPNLQLEQWTAVDSKTQIPMLFALEDIEIGQYLYFKYSVDTYIYPKRKK